MTRKEIEEIVTEIANPVVNKHSLNWWMLNYKRRLKLVSAYIY